MHVSIKILSRSETKRQILPARNTRLPSHTQVNQLVLILIFSDNSFKSLNKIFTTGKISPSQSAVEYFYLVEIF